MAVKETLEGQTELTPRQKNFVVAYEKHMGMASKACKEIGLSQSTYFLWKNKCTVFKEAIDEANEAIKDWGESALHGLINSGNPQAIIFYNKTKNKDRGYVEKKEIEHSNNEPIKINVVMPKEAKNEDN